MASYPQQLNPGMFVPTTNIWDVSRLYEVEVGSQEFKELLVRLYQNVNNIALALNLKDTGYYTLEEFLNSQAFFPNPLLNSTTSQQPTYRQVFRKTINFGSLPNTGVKSLPHGINVTTGYSFTRIYGCSSNTARTSFIPLPFASPIDTEEIKLEATNTDVIVTTGSNRSDYITTYIILEYLKQ